MKTIEEFRQGILQKDFTAEEIADDYLNRIEEKNKELNIYLEVTAEQAKAAAKVVDEKQSRGEKLSAIAGAPASIKDNYNWVDTHTTASSKILENYISPYTATVVQRIVDHDAVILGKTNMDAFAHGSSTETSDFGVTLNPVDKTRVAGGSSGGSAASVAAGLAIYSLGSETAGSVRGPAAWCGIYGFVPTYGVNSRYGIVAMGSSLDRPGVLANCVIDCAMVTDAMAGHDPQDATSAQLERAEYMRNLSREMPGGKSGKLRIGIPDVFLDERIDQQVAAGVEAALKQFESLDVEIKPIKLLDPKYAMAVYTILCRSEVSSNLARIDGIRYGYYSDELAETIIDQIALNRGQGFGNEAKQRSMTGAFALSTGYYDAYYRKAQQVRTMIIEDFRAAFNEVDLIVGPTMPTVAPKIGVTANNPLFGELADILTEPSALAGLPCMSLPIGENSEGLPIGMQIIGPQFAEQLVLNTSYAFEQTFLL